MRIPITCMLVVAVACSSKSAPPPTAGSGSGSAAPVAPAPDVHVDRRVELVALVFRLAGAPEYADPKGTPYLTDLDRTFADFAKHPAVAMTRELIKHHHIAYDAPMDLAIHLDDRIENLRGSPLGSRWTGVDVPAYLAQLRAFAADAKLDAFLTSHRVYITAVEERYRKAIAKENPGPWFVEMFGISAKRFVVIPGLQQGPNNYGADDGQAMYQLLGLGLPTADGLPEITAETMRTLVHEMAHSFINPIFDRHPELARTAAPLFNLVATTMEEQHYGVVQIMLDESGVRATTTLYIRERNGAAAAASADRYEVRRGFVWNAELTDVLSKFHNSGSTDLEAYMPKIVEFFAGQAKRYEHGLPPMAFLGPLDAVITQSPTIVHSPDPALAKYADAIRQRFLKTAKLEVATNSTFEHDPHVGLMAYGSPTTNPIVAHVLMRAQIKLTADGLELGTKKFPGPAIVLLACWPRVDDPSKGIVIYTAASDATVVGINSVTAGGTDYVVAEKLPDGTFKTLAMGDFPHAADGAWMLP